MTRVSIGSSGTQANAASVYSAITADGRYVAFSSSATNLVSGDTNGSDDVFVRDLVAGTTSRVSVSSAGVQGNGTAVDPAISADGRYVAFDSQASNLVAGDTTNNLDVFVRDRVAGTTSRLTSDSRNSYDPAISGDGRYVAFRSSASNLVAGDTNNEDDVFVRDRVAATTSRVSIDSSGTQANGESGGPAISGDGRYVAFESAASNLVAGDTNSVTDVFVRDRDAGTTGRVNVNLIGKQADGGFGPRISADGRYIGFSSGASRLVAGDTNNDFDVFVRANPEPTVTGIAPATLSQGTTTPVTVSGTHFLSGAQLVIDGGGVTLANVTIVNETEITADVTVAADATLSTRNVFVELPGTAPAPAISAVGLCADCLTVN